MFAMFYCLLDLSCGEGNVISLYVLCCVSDSVCELLFKGVVKCGWRCSVG